jgi:integrase
MARTVRDAKLETRAARDRLPTGRTPHFKTLVPGKLHLGYRRKKKDLPGQWLVRHYLGRERYHTAPLGRADDFQDASDDNDFLTFADAQRMAHEHRVERRLGRGMSVADAIAEYVKEVRKEREATADDAERTAALLILPRLGRFKLADLKTKDITDWRDALAREPARTRTRPGEPQKFKATPATKKAQEEAQRARRATANRIMTVLRAALNRAFKDGHVQDDLAWRRVEPFGKVAAARSGFLSVVECKRLINAANRASGFRDLVRAALTTGCRYGELCALEVRDFQRGKIAIRDSKSGKPRDVVLTQEGVAFFEQLAAGRGSDEIMLRNRGRVARGLERERQRCERLRKQGKAVEAVENVKIDDDGQWRSSEQARPMREACERAKIAPAVGIHQLRHTYASLCVMAEMPLMVLARNLGHANTLMVEKHYGHLREDYIDKAIRASAPTFGIKADKKIVALR